MTNKEIAERFAAQFDPRLAVVRTERINGQPVADAWCVAYWDNDTRLGITAHVVRGRIHAYLEAEHDGAEVERIGRMMAEQMGMAKDGQG